MFKNLSLKVIIFGFIFTFFSCFGQSFFIGLFNSSIRETLSITHGQFGTIYASATLFSSLLLIWIGKKIDDVNVLKFAIYVTVLLSFSSFFFSKTSSVAFLFVAIFLMRFSGQGLMSHTASTTISRYFTKSRGKALSIIWFGLSSAEFIMPVLIVYLLTLIVWQDLWVIFSLIVLICLPLASYILVKDVKLDTREGSQNKILKEENIKNWKRIEVLGDYRFYIVSLNMLAMPWIATGVFVYQSFVTNSKGWGEYTIAQSFMSYSIFSVITFMYSLLNSKFTILSLFFLIKLINDISSFFERYPYITILI